MNFHNHILRSKSAVAPLGDFVYSVTVAALETISLPMYNLDDSLYDFTVNFGDLTGDKAVSAYADIDREHTYTGAGTYDITISGLFDYIRFTDSPNSIIEVKSWGVGKIGQSSFSYCINLDTLSATDLPLIRNNVLISTFNHCPLTTVDASIDDWDVSLVTDMRSLFWTSSGFNQYIGSWSTGNCTLMIDMFNTCSLFNQDISAWDVSKVTTMSSMFRGSSFNQDIGIWNVIKVTSMRSMFNALTYNHDLSGWITSSLEDVRSMFYNSGSNQNLGNWDISNLLFADDLFNFGSLSTTNYDLLLVGWESQVEQPNVVLHVGNAKYSAGAPATARAALVSNGWTITDGGPV